MKKINLRQLYASILCALALACTIQAQGQDLGDIDFPNSGSVEAQEAFIRGVLLLHSFEFEDARESFIAAREVDPEFALAYWGEAMTHNHPLWREVDTAAAHSALKKLAPTKEGRLAKAPTEREKGYLRAIEVLYGEGDKVERDEAYSASMRRLHGAYPEDLEAASFYALSILGTTQGSRDFSVYMKAASVAEEVFDKNPRHPGAVHYLIHSYDDPVHAPLGLRAARVYNEIAPAASHAQHMISHIFVALGSWDETVTANVKAFDVSVERADRKGLGVDAKNYHALHWMHYALLQQGRYGEARKRLDQMEAFARESGSRRAVNHFTFMRAAYGVETGQWADLPPSQRTSDTGLRAAAVDLFTTGFVASATGDRAGAGDALAKLRSRIPENAGSKPAEDDIAEAAIMAMELEAQLLFADGKREEAVAIMQKVAAAEDELPFAFGPPHIVKPSHELLGEMLLEVYRPDAAVASFRRALTRAPRRTRSLLGLARAASISGADEEAAEAYAQARLSWRGPDDQLPKLEAAKEPLNTMLRD